MNHNFDFPETRPSRIKIIIIIVAAILLYGLFAGIRANTSLLATEIAEFTGISYGEVSTAFSILNLVLAIGIPLISIFTLKIQKFYIMLIGAILCAVGFIGTAFSTTPIQLILFIGILFGLGTAFLSFTIVYSAAKPFVGDKVSGILAGVLLASQGILGMITSHAIDGFIHSLGLTLCLIIISVSALCLIPFTFLFLQRKKNENIVKKEENTQESYSIKYVLKKLLRNPIFYIVALGALAFGMGDGGLINHSSQYLEELFETGEYSSALISIYSISIMVGCLVGGFLSDKVKSKTAVCGVIFLSWAVLNGIIQLLVLNNSFGLSIPVVTICLTFSTGFLINITCPMIIGIVVERVSIAVSAVALGFIDFSTYIAYSLNSFFGGIFHDIFGNFDLIDAIATFLAILAGTILVIYAIKHRNKKPDIII